MLKFILRRTFYSALVILGVVLLTFLLFSVAAGDPAAAVLGKNARPDEVESLRRELGADLPLFYGRLCRTEAYGAFAAGAPLPPGWEESDGVFRVTPQFAVEHAVCRIIREGRAETFSVDGVVELEAAGLSSAEFYRTQANPLHTRFSRALGEIVCFQPEFPYIRVLDFGRTLTTREPIGRLLRRGVMPSLMLMAPIFCGELLLGLLLALVAAAYKDTWLDRSLVILSVAGISVSYLAVIIFAQWYLGYYFDLFPVWGFEGFASLALPIAVGIACGLGGSVRFYRTVFVNELQKEYLRTAAAKGLPPGQVFGKHLLRNAALQIITRAGAALPFLFTGSLLLESFFGIPGLGYMGVDALYNSDIQLLKALVILSALMFVLINLLTDLAYAWADPRIRLE